ncbi:MAG: hypothetical protein AAGI07_11145 [Bacteroidota bacterium]
MSINLNRKQVLLPIAFIILSMSAYSQGRVYLITLKPNQNIEKEFYVSEVIDYRPNKENIGIAYKGLFNDKVPAKFGEDFEIHLTKTFKALLPRSETKIPLIVRVRKLFVSEQESHLYELGRCEVELEFLRRKDSALYTLGSFSSITEKKGLDLTDTHHKRIVEALIDCIDQFSNSDWTNRSGELVITDNKEIKYNFDAKIPLNQGLYLSFSSISDNTPINDIEYDIKLIKQTKKIERYQVYHKGTKKRVKDIFGFSDGEFIYLNASSFTSSNYYVKSKMIGRYIYFEDEFHLPEMGLTLGIIGTLASTEYRGIILDTKSGIIKVLTIEDMKLFLSNEPELLARYKKSDKSIEIVREIISEMNIAAK